MIKVFPNIEELNRFASEKFIEIGNEVIEKYGRFTVVLAGGSTPKSLYQLLASDRFKDKIEWSKVFFFFGDERNVLPDNAESNFRMANENLFEPLQIPSENIFRWQTKIPNIRKIAQDYEEKIVKFFKLRENEIPKFDLIFLGMGDDGHTASLFPFTKALHETEKLAVENWVKKFNNWRFTLTLLTINNAENVIFLVSDASKSKILRDVLEGESEHDKFPSQIIKPKKGNLYWLIDEKAARFLDN
ncbi:6-phosphogluconolactonase [soil metagenome]